MIFITLGSQKFQFNRLLKEIDFLIDKKLVKDEVFAQIGYSDYIPRNYNFCRFMDRDEFAEMEKKANIVITHGGTGAIIGSIKKGKKVIAVPRLAKYGEHVDNHQVQLIGEFTKQNLICGINDCSELKEALEYVKDHKFDEYHSNTQAFLTALEKFINSNI